MSEDLFKLSAGVPVIEGKLREKPKVSARISNRVVYIATGIGVLLLGIVLYAWTEIDSKSAPRATLGDRKEDKNKKLEKRQPLKPGEDPLGVDSAKSTEPKSATLMKPAGAAAEVAAGTANGTGMAAATASTDINAPAPPPSATEGLEHLPGVPKSSGATDSSKTASLIKGQPQGTQVPPISQNKTQIPNQANASQGGLNGQGRQITPAEQAKAAAETERNARMKQARSSGLSGRAWSVGPAGGQDGLASANNALTQAQEALRNAAAAGGAQVQPVAMNGLASAGQSTSDAEQNEKLDFLKNSGKEVHNYHPHMPVPQVSNLEVKVGQLIPLRLERGINSDLPGYVTARVSEWVYDTKTGCLGLIPPLTVVIGKYDSKIAIGQQRILSLWNAMVFPDGSELNLSGMQGYDNAGMAGMQADVDNHYLRLFGIGLGMSLFSAGTQSMVPATSQTSGTNTVPTYGQQVATALAQQYGQMGAQLIGKYTAIQPTLKNYAGESFNIMVPRTIVFTKVWRKRC